MAHRSCLHPRLLLLLSLLVGACFVNEAEESPGNDASQDVGLHIRLDGNFVLNGDGTRAVTTALLEDSPTRVTTHLVAVTLPQLRVIRGPSIDGLMGVELMTTPDPDLYWLIGTRDTQLEVSPLDVDTMELGAPIVIAGDGYNGAVLSGSGRRLAMATVWDPDSPDRLTLLEVPDTVDDAMGFDGVPASTPVDDFSGALYDVRFTRDGARMVVLSAALPNEQQPFEPGATYLNVYDTATPGAVTLLDSYTFAEHRINLLAKLTWAIRISPDGRYAAVSGKGAERVQTIVIDLVAGELHGIFELDGPVGFTPDSLTMVGFRGVGDDASELVMVDLAARTIEATPLAFRNPIYWIAPDGRRIVTHPLTNRGLVITDLDTGESTRSDGEAVALHEFVVSPDGDFVYLVDMGGLFMLDIELGDVSQLEPKSREYDNINILPDGDHLLLTRLETTRFELWSLLTATTTGGVSLPAK